jgi:hypothetical protein
MYVIPWIYYRYFDNFSIYLIFPPCNHLVQFHSLVLLLFLDSLTLSAFEITNPASHFFFYFTELKAYISVFCINSHRHIHLLIWSTKTYPTEDFFRDQSKKRFNICITSHRHIHLLIWSTKTHSIHSACRKRKRGKSWEGICRERHVAQFNLTRTPSRYIPYVPLVSGLVLASYKKHCPCHEIYRTDDWANLRCFWLLWTGMMVQGIRTWWGISELRLNRGLHKLSFVCLIWNCYRSLWMWGTKLVKRT